jgi:hypothetical protein
VPPKSIPARSSRQIAPDDTFGRWTVLSRSERKRHWLCRCECGNMSNVYEGNMAGGLSKGCRECGSKDSTAIRTRDLSGQRFGRLTVVRASSKRTRHRGAYWECLCDCGTTKIVKSKSLLTPFHPTTSCGCFQKEIAAIRHTTHGGYDLPEYSVWQGMKSRCYIPKATHYDCYGGRGITVCDRWRDSFAAFLEDMGRRPSPKHTIERVDVNGNYSPDNCVWLIQDMQKRNTRRNVNITHEGKTMVLAEWSRLTGIPQRTIRRRLQRGLSTTESLCSSKAQPK